MDAIKNAWDIGHFPHFVQMLCFSNIVVLVGARQRNRQEFDDELRVICERLELRKQEYDKECRELVGRSAKIERILLRIWAVSYTHLDVYKRQAWDIGHFPHFVQMLCFSNIVVLVGARQRNRQEFDDELRVICERLELRKQEYDKECRELVGRSAKIERILLRIWAVSYTHLDVYKRQAWDIGHFPHFVQMLCFSNIVVLVGARQRNRQEFDDELRVICERLELRKQEYDKECRELVGRSAKIERILLRIWAVSYTHLDVYKRQAWDIGHFPHFVQMLCFSNIVVLVGARQRNRQEFDDELRVICERLELRKQEYDKECRELVGRSAKIERILLRIWAVSYTHLDVYKRQAWDIGHFPHFVQMLCFSNIVVLVGARQRNRQEFDDELRVICERLELRKQEYDKECRELVGRSAKIERILLRIWAVSYTHLDVYKRQAWDIGHFPHFVQMLCFSNIVVLVGARQRNRQEFDDELRVICERLELRKQEYDKECRELVGRSAKIERILLRIWAVSYTHLDVYKRQAWDIGHFPHFVQMLCFSNIVVLVGARQRNRQEFDDELRVICERLELRKQEYDKECRELVGRSAKIERILLRIWAVSYTHLDVYKRQAWDIGHFPHFVQMLCFSNIVVLVGARQRNRQEFDDELRVICERLELRKQEYDKECRELVGRSAKIERILLRIWAVSYTHLDVYKRQAWDIGHFPHFVQMLCFSNIVVLVGARQRNRQEFDDELRVICERLELRKQEYDKECRELVGRSAKIERILLRIWGVDDSHLEGRFRETRETASPITESLRGTLGRGLGHAAEFARGRATASRTTKCDDLVIEAEEREEMERAIVAIATTMRNSPLTDSPAADSASEQDRYTAFAPMTSAYWVEHTSTAFRHAIWKMETFNHVAQISIRALQFLGNITDAQVKECRAQVLKSTNVNTSGQMITLPTGRRSWKRQRSDCDAFLHLRYTSRVMEPLSIRKIINEVLARIIVDETATWLERAMIGWTYNTSIASKLCSPMEVFCDFDASQWLEAYDPERCPVQIAQACGHAQQRFDHPTPVRRAYARDHVGLVNHGQSSSPRDHQLRAESHPLYDPRRGQGGGRGGRALGQAHGGGTGTAGTHGIHTGIYAEDNPEEGEGENDKLYKEQYRHVTAQPSEHPVVKRELEFLTG
ncbi:hypothetical protein CBR_g46606 [Chara braunii]|uniref:Uncharacterized protein n=1 Tax=Chara braunii TaxID=69332 RepID=A0A388M0L9_CHABU|nr:hypothetical protein CBR_g46606 [Chara braunii]|eukprot:GBG88117.1 hypothetical protein CBR_g46606 [Chara braunii]